jgi:hypothetical protein
MLSKREVTGKYSVKETAESSIQCNCDINCDNLCHKSIQQMKFLTPIHKNE